MHGRKGLAADVYLGRRVKGGLAKAGHQGNVRTGLEALSRAKTVKKCLRQQAFDTASIDLSMEQTYN